MKNISVTVDDDTHRRLRIMAAEEGTSVSALIRDQMLRVLEGSTHQATEETANEKHRRELMALLEEFQRKGIGISAGDRLAREEIYQRGTPN